MTSLLFLKKCYTKPLEHILKTMRSLLLILALILVSKTSNAQSISKNRLIGKWALVTKTDSFPDDIKPLEVNNSTSKLKKDSKEKLKTTLTFKKDNKIFINQMGNEYSATYKLIDSTLTLGNRKYIIVEIDKKKLIYKDKDGLFDNHYEYKKLE
ncbi:conserved hypothetical protein [Tenacibaculum sp. 190524A05c]